MVVFFGQGYIWIVYILEGLFELFLRVVFFGKMGRLGEIDQKKINALEGVGEQLGFI